MAKSKIGNWRWLAMGTSGWLLLGSLAACGGSGGSGLLSSGLDPTFPPPIASGPPPIVPPQTLASVPPPISGGTLLITRDGTTAVAADPDRDCVWLVDLQKQAVRTRVLLPSGTEPGRAVEDQDGSIHVALRSGGQVVKLDPQSGAILATHSVCAAPRGLAYDPATDNLHVACAGGELVTMTARSGDTLRTLSLDRDLRDVLVKGDHLLISRFRTAELLELDATGALLGRVKPRQSLAIGVIDPMGKPVTSTPTTAWRTVAMPDGSVVMLHQRALDGTISTKTGGYGSGPCKASGIVSTAMTIFSGATGGTMSTGNGTVAMLMSMAVDVVATPDGQQLALITSGSNGMFPSVALLPKSAFTPGDGCQFPAPLPTMPIPPTAQLIAGAYDNKGHLWIQSRNPAQLVGATGAQILFTGAEDRSNEGHRLFHTPTQGMIACASCHAEGGDDGHVWTFDTVGPRRTQDLRGGILATAPFHWDGDMTDITTLMNQVFSGRMAGGFLAADQIRAVGAWMDGQPALPKGPPKDPAAVERGKTVFNDPVVACANCHSGAHFTNNLNASVGTGQNFQVPSLNDVVSRAPYLHSGCAATLRDRFNPTCGGGDSHGKTSQLSSGQLDDLVAYLETL